MAEFEVDFNVDVRDAIRDLNKVGVEGAKSIKKIEQQTSRLSQVFNSFAGNLAAIGVAKVFDGLVAGAQKLANVLFTGSIQAAIEQEKAVNDLNTSLSLAGEFSEDASESFQNLASSLQQSSTVGDEVILQQAALARNFARSNEEAQELIKVALDLSAATGISLDSAVRNVGKTFSGLQGELGELVPQVRNLTQEQLRAGDALRVLGERFGGAAQAQTRTFSGALEQAGNSFGDLQEAIGETVTNSELVTTVIGEANRIFVDLGNTIRNNQESIRQFAGDVIDILVTGFQIGVQAVNVFSDVFAGLQITFNLVAAGIAEAINLLVKSFRGFAEVAALTGNKTAIAIRDGLKDTEKSLREFAKFQIEDTKRVVEDAEKRGDAFASFGAKVEEVNKKIQASVANTAEFEKQTAEENERRRQERIQKENEELEQKKIKEAEDAAALQEKQQQGLEQRIAEIQEENALLAQIDRSANEDQINRNNATLKALEENDAVSNNTRLKLKADRLQKERALDRQALSAASSLSADLITLSQGQNRQVFEAAKALGIATATISTFQGASRALADFPFPVSLITAAAVIAKGLVQVSKIRSTGFQTGLTEVPPGFPNDTFNARLTSGERVVSAPQNQDLKEFIANNGQTNQLLGAVVSRLDNLEMQTVVNIGNREIVNEINTATREGRVLEA